MKQQTKLSFLAFLLALGLAGCAGAPAAPDVDHRHPASVHAEASPMPPLENGLLSFTNMVRQPTAPQSGPEHHHGHLK